MGNGGKITVKRTIRHRPSASLGIGFNSKLISTFSCAGSSTPVGGALVNINPRYDDTDPHVAAIAVTMTYAKSATPGSASSYDVCFRKDEQWHVGRCSTQCASTSP